MNQIIYYIINIKFKLMYFIADFIIINKHIDFN